jgi:hypothetical protein
VPLKERFVGATDNGPGDAVEAAVAVGDALGTGVATGTESMLLPHAQIVAAKVKPAKSDLTIHARFASNRSSNLY